MNKINCRFCSPWIGNGMFCYAFSRAYAEQNNCEFYSENWVGNKVFELNDPYWDCNLPRRADVEFPQWKGELNVTTDGYAQNQNCLIYSRADARRYFRFRPEIQSLLDRVPIFDMCGHLRHGDYTTTPGFISIKPESYCTACANFGFDPAQLHFVSQECPCVIPELTDMGLGFLPDFYQLMKARILFRANSTFSWWAAVLGNAERVFSPNVEGIRGSDGELRDAPFEEGNHCNFTNHCWFTTNLHLRET